MIITFIVSNSYTFTSGDFDQIMQEYNFIQVPHGDGTTFDYTSIYFSGSEKASQRALIEAIFNAKVEGTTDFTPIRDFTGFTRITALPNSMMKFEFYLLYNHPITYRSDPSGTYKTVDLKAQFGFD